MPTSPYRFIVGAGCFIHEKGLEIVLVLKIIRDSVLFMKITERILFILMLVPKLKKIS